MSRIGSGARIHPSAVVEPGANLADGVEVGPLATIGPEVELAEGVRIGPHVAILGRTRIGARSEVHPFACLGGPPQDHDFAGETTSLEIGEDNVIREHVTIHVGTEAEGGCTRIGDDNLIMNSAHIAHDCRVGSHCVVASFSGLAGHVSVDDYAVLGAYTGVHQYSRVGESVMTASNTKLSLDAPPFSIVAGDRAHWIGVNYVGLKRRGVSRERQQQIKRAYTILFQSQLSLTQALKSVREELKEVPDVERLVSFLETSGRGFCR
ncbi:MAG: acyl-ACP--UDP-N-acetylglucosamine O-acyltransferase [Myxococcales bacterium]|nr:acyl-ACP--UDP-N-acetylglucosamine O-acyltransferase [Myxococcales bacterium]